MAVSGLSDAGLPGDDVEDATGRSVGRFGAQDTIWAVVGVLRAGMAQYGSPRALYTDWKNVYVRPPNQAERAIGSRAAHAIRPDVRDIRDHDHPGELAAAKGRIERHHGTHQDRLVKRLRRAGIADVADANAFSKRPTGPSTIVASVGLRAYRDSGGTRTERRRVDSTANSGVYRLGLKMSACARW